MKKMIVACSGKIRTAALEKLQDQVELLTWQQRGRVPAETMAAWLQKAEALYSIGNIRVNEALLAQAPHLRVVAQSSVGYDNIDVAACTAHGVLVGNTPGVLVEAVGDLGYGLLIDTARKLVQGDRHVRSGAWGAHKGLGFGVDLYGKTLGILGLGAVGGAIARRALASGMKLQYHNRHQHPEAERLGAKYTDFDTLLATSDFILVCVTLNPSTVKLLDREAFAKMKDGVRLVNISRGRVVDTEALTEALQSGKVAAAALDVTDPEPLPGDHPLLKFDNVTVTPHIATSTVETRDAMAVLTADNILAALAGKPMPAQVKLK